VTHLSQRRCRLSTPVLAREGEPRAQFPCADCWEIRRPSPGRRRSASPPSVCREFATTLAFVTDVMLAQIPGAVGHYQRHHPPNAGRGRTSVRFRRRITDLGMDWQLGVGAYPRKQHRRRWAGDVYWVEARLRPFTYLVQKFAPVYIIPVTILTLV
jgi:hypothetical protein